MIINSIKISLSIVIELILLYVNYHIYNLADILFMGTLFPEIKFLTENLQVGQESCQFGRKIENSSR